MTEAKRTATLSEHAARIRQAIADARADGFRLSLEDRDDYGRAYVDLEEYDVFADGRRSVTNWVCVIKDFD